MRRILFLVAVMIFFCLLLSGCSTYIHPAIMLPANPDHYSDELAIAIDLAGVKHIARIECPLYTATPCKLVYTRVRPGLPNHQETVMAWDALPGQTLHDIDIAVTDGGIAYIVVRWDGRPGATVASELFAIRSDLPLVFTPVETTHPVADKPIVKARGNVVYVSFDVNYYNPITYQTYRQTRYLQLTNPAVGGWVNSCFSTAPCTLYDTAVGWNGYLYVTYEMGDGLYYADNYGVSGDMTNQVYVSTYYSSIADIDVNGIPETVYIIYDDTREFEGFSNGLFINHCLAASCTSQTIDVVPMPHAELWRLQGNPQIVADIINTAYFIFVGHNALHPNTDVYVGSFQVGPVFGALTRMTDTSAEETNESICLTWSFNPVAAWRVDLGGGDYGNVFESDFTHLAGVAVRVTSVGKEEYDLACNADWAAGIWNEVTSGVRQTWISFNSYPGLMPIINK